MPDTLKIVYMGTPDFAVPALKAIHGSRHGLIEVITQPDRPRGRGRKQMPPPVKETARALGYPVFQPAKVRTPEFHAHLEGLSPDLLVLIAYGNLLPESVLRIPRLGSLNIHASLLPEYRGSAPIQWAIIRGERTTGVTAMMMDKGMDTGPVLDRRAVEIGPADTSRDLHDRLSVVGAELLIPVLDRLADGTAVATEQDHSRATYAPMLKKSDGRIDWSRPADGIACLIRGVNPWPTAFTAFGEKQIKIYRAEALPDPEGGPASDTAPVPPGTVVPGFPDELRVAAGEGILSILELQIASGRRLPVADFLRGHPIAPGSRFS